MSISLHKLPLYPRRKDFDNEGDYQWAVEHWDELQNEAEDLAMEKYYKKKYGM